MDRTPPRPPPDTLTVRAYDFPVPAADAVLARSVRHGRTVLTVSLTPAGHVVEWKCGRAVVCEVLGRAAGLPAGFRAGKPAVGVHAAKFAAAGLSYRMSVQAEELPDDVFLHIHDEITADGAKAGVFAAFAPKHRFGLAPLSWVNAEILPTGLSVTTFHTFPDVLTVVKTQSLIEAE